MMKREERPISPHPKRTGKKVNIVLADGNDIMRQGLQSLLEAEPDFSVVGEIIHGSDAVDLVERIEPDILILDLTMPEVDSLDVTRHITQRFSQTRVLILSMYNEEDYFLEDFRGLQAALPLVRPTVFFSIPRFYEKLWHVLEESRLGKIYLHTSSQLVKNLLQPFLRRVLLTKSGLDRCEQLIVGSAPSNEKLLFSFKELGVEVHDAYGLTEAPLVTINRVGRNHIGTVGQPLPQTQIKEAEDGEILVKGPQVMQGYHTKTTCRLIDGAWLPTGDLGKVGEKGDLIIYGRKKNLIATSYGKKISPYKIESMLKELSGVDQAMLIGELKPYISALVWSGQSEKESGILDSINKGIIEINTKVSHPEQIHRWVILKNDLSIEQGDLTPNFKLKRRNISRRFGKIIETLYQDDHPAGDPVLSFGRSEA